MPDDDELYSRFLTGDSSALDMLMLRYAGRMTLYLGALLHNEHDAEDLVIDTFAAVLAKRPKIREGHFQAYIYQAARNRAFRFHAVRKRTVLFSPDENLLPEMQEVHPQDIFLQDERRRALHRCLGRIDPEPREALWLVYFENMSYAQAAAVMGVSPKKVDNLLGKGKRLMRRELEAEGFEGFSDL